MTFKRETNDAAWETLRQITEPDHPLDPITSLLARERNRVLKEGKWRLIWDDVDLVLESAAEQTAATYDRERGALAPWYHRAVEWRLQDALDRKFENCPACSRPASIRLGASEGSSADVDTCGLCNGSGRVPKDLAVNTDQPEKTEYAKARESCCPSCHEGEVQGQDCRQCGGTGILRPEAEDVSIWPSPEQQGSAENRIFADLIDKLPGWLPRPLDLDFVHALADAFRSLSPASKFQMRLDEQLFATDNHRTSSEELQKLVEKLSMTPEAIRTARGRIRTRLRSVFETHGVDVPQSLADRKTATATTREAEGGVAKEVLRSPRSPVFKDKPSPLRPREEHQP